MGRSTFLRSCFYVGAVADLVAALPLLSPAAASAMFGVAPAADPVRAYVSWIAASLMLGWSVLLFWGSLRPLERKGVLLITVAPVLMGLLAASIAVVVSGAIAIGFMAPLWVFYAVVIPAFLVGFVHARIRIG